jgi:OPA family glycerol-3-phosphate transporter-like MFS transporter
MPLNSKTGPSSRYILWVCTVAYASVYIARNNLSIASTLLTDSGRMTLMEVGLMGSIFYIVYAAGRFVNGYIGDLISPKKLLLCGMAMVGATNIGIGFLPPAALIIGLWGINAAAQSLLWGPSLRLVNDSYRDSPRSRLAAVILSTSIGSGSLLAIVISTLLVKAGLRWIFIVPGLIVACICALVLRLPDFNNRLERKSLLQVLGLVKNKDILCMLLPSFGHGLIKENLVLWAPTLFLKMYGIDITSAALYVFMMPGAMLLGRIAYPLAERVCKKDERRVSLLAFGFCILCFAPFFLAYLPIGLAALLLALAMLGISMINVAFMAVTPTKYGDSGQVSLVAGLLDGTSYIGSSAGSALFAWIISYGGQATLLGGCILICLVSIGSMLPLLKKIN